MLILYTNFLIDEVGAYELERWSKLLPKDAEMDPSKLPMTRRVALASVCGSHGMADMCKKAVQHTITAYYNVVPLHLWRRLSVYINKC